MVQIRHDNVMHLMLNVASGTQHVQCIPVSELLHWPIITPDWQRFVDKKRVESMYMALRQQYSVGVPVYLPITLVKLNTQYYLIDGQHRFHVYVRLFKKADVDTTLLVNTIVIQHESDLVTVCRFLNDSESFTVPPHIEHMKQAKALVNTYRPILEPYLSTARKPRRPNMTLHQFTEAVVQALDTVSDANQLLQKMRDFNAKCDQATLAFFRYPTDTEEYKLKNLRALVRRKAATYAKKQKWTEAKPCYFGLFPNGDWVAKLDQFVPQQIVPAIEQTAQKRRPKRKAMTKAERLRVWNHYVGVHARVGQCFVCAEEIRLEIFECGHVKAVARGGTNSLNNLRPICRVCNASCGSRNLLIFKKQSLFCQQNTG